jgi:hypothetical protein
MQNRTSYITPLIEPLHLALALCDWISHRAADLEAPEVLEDSNHQREANDRTLLLANDSRSHLHRTAVRRVGLALVATTIVAGCSQSELPVYPAVGHVTFENEWPLGTRVVLHPLSNDSSIRPQGVVDALGNFRVTTFRDGDGAPPGEYIVTLVWHKFVIDGEDYKPGPNVLPPMYAEPATSPLIVEVAKKSNEFKPFTLSRCDSEVASLTPIP